MATPGSRRSAAPAYRRNAAPAAATRRPVAGGLAGHAAAALAALMPADGFRDGVVWPDGPPADQRLADYFRRHPALGKRDRRWIADRVFDVLRQGALYRAFAGGASPTPADLIEVSRAAEADDGAAVGRFADTCPEALRYSLPAWLWERLEASHPGGEAAAIAAALLRPAPVDLRCNLLRGRPEALRQALAERGIDALPVAGASTALRVAGRAALERLDLFEQGWFEPQDAGSQMIADACGARRGERIVDFCAGAGGKSLALAARMRNSGQILAFDTDGERLARLVPRAARAGVSIITSVRIDGVADPRLSRYAGRADRVLVDAPCSGTGTLRRSPDLKWRLHPGLLAYYRQQQQAILAVAATLVRPGGLLVYATCSLLDEENELQVGAFAPPADGRRGPGQAPAGTVGRSNPRPATFVPTEQARWLPGPEGGDGFFVAKWELRSPGGGLPGTIQ